jgi:hypothetical protein
MVDKQHARIFIDVFDAKPVMRVRKPVRVLDAGNVRVVIVMVRLEMDVRWRQERRRDRRRHQQQAERRATEA